MMTLLSPTRHGAILTIVAGMFLVAPVARSAEAPTAAVRSTINEVLRILKDESLKKPDRAKERRQLLEKTIGERFSYEEMSKRSLGAQWNKLSADQRKE